MKVTFTLCSVNYLSQALSLGDSLKSTNPQYRFIIGLVDRLDCHQLAAELQPYLQKYEMLEMHTIGIAAFDKMVEKYDITELNTAVKPFYIDYFFKHIPDIEQVIYFDPDILVYEPLTELDNNLQQHNFVVTPHLMTPINDEKLLGEHDINNAGLYNLGFIAVKKSDEAQRFIDWWMARLERYCYTHFHKGLFVDQIWVNFLPLFFKGTHIERDFGYNISYWNLHERTITRNGHQYTVNNYTSVKFYHFSGYKPGNLESISKYQNRFTFEQRPDVVPLYKGYSDALFGNQQKLFSTYKCYYITLKETGLVRKYKAFKQKVVKNLLQKLSDYYMRKYNY